MFKLLLFLLVFLSVFVVFSSRVKRGLVFPLGGTFKLVIGVGTPIKLSQTRTITLGWNFQWQYALATNTTMLETYPPILSNRKKRDILEENDLKLNEIYEILGFHEHQSSKSCILRFICEEAFSSFRNNGKLGNFLHILFTPRMEESDKIFLDAQRAGKFGVNCGKSYKCRDNFLEYFL